MIWPLSRRRSPLAENPENPEINPAEPDPRARLMQEVAQQMDAIEADYPGGFQIGRVVTVVEVAHQDGSGVELRVRANMLPWVTLGMLKAAERSVGASGAPAGPEAD
jgi:hypothetical protein